MKVGLIHLGGALPNLALMRLSAYHKALGDEVSRERPGPLDGFDRVYISTLFTWRRAQVDELVAQFSTHADVTVGGSGWDFTTTLPAAAEGLTPDYSLYGIDYGMGYTTRGCIRHCKFCPVPRMEGGIHEADRMSSLLNPKSNKLMLLDNNFFAADSWREKVAEIRRRGLVVDWPQGNDIRLMTDEIAAALADLQAHDQIAGDQFTSKGWLHFAWDLPANDARTEEVVRGIRLLKATGFRGSQLRFYVLIGYPGYSVEDELHRVTTLHAEGIEPYVMVYRDYGAKDTRDPLRMRIQHWNNGHAWRKVRDFAEFNSGFEGERGAYRAQLALGLEMER